MSHSVMKEFHRLVRRIDRLTDGQAYMGEINWDNGSLDEFVVFIMPNAGYYRGGKFKFTISVPDTYPSEDAPFVWCHTHIYHPNINPTQTREEAEMSNVCLNILSSDWNPAIGLEGVVLGLIFLLYNPNQDDDMSLVFYHSKSKEEFAEKVRRSLAGDVVDEFYYEVNNCNEKEVEQEGDAANTVATAWVEDEKCGRDGVNADMNVDEKEIHAGSVDAIEDMNVNEKEGHDGSIDKSADTNVNEKEGNVGSVDITADTNVNEKEGHDGSIDKSADTNVNEKEGNGGSVDITADINVKHKDECGGSIDVIKDTNSDELVGRVGANSTCASVVISKFLQLNPKTKV